MKQLAVLITITVVALTAVPADAAWEQGGKAIFEDTSTQRYQQIVSDSEGNAIIVWEDYREITYSDIYAQMIDRHGNMLWTSGGIGVATGTAHQTDPMIVSDGEGGATILWEEWDFTSYYLKAMRIDSDGNDVWASEAILVTHSSSINLSAITSDLSGGAICAWYSDASGNFDIYAQRVDADGVIQYGTDGKSLCNDTGNQQQPWLCSDGSGGAIVAWRDYRNGNWDIYARKIDAGGSVYWPYNGVEVSTAVNTQASGDIVPDGSGGAYVVWPDNRSGSYDIYAQHFSSGGVAQWTADGIIVCGATSTQTNCTAVSDGSGGAVFAWSDDRINIDDLYAQRIASDGSACWTSDGIVVCANSRQQLKPDILLTETGSYIFTWYDSRAIDYDVYAQMVDPSGTPQWQANGVLLSLETMRGEDPCIASDGEGGAIVAWKRYLSTGSDIWAQRVERNGYWGYPAPVIAGVRDVPGDQGGSVDLAFYASRLDPWPEMDISEYTVWRAIGHPEAMLMVDSGARIIDSVSELADGDGTLPVTPGRDIIRRETVGTTIYFWKMISTIEPYYLDSYSEVVATLFDSTSASDEYHYFQVIAHSFTPSAFWISTPDSGYSVDNLAPVVPLGFAGEQSYTPEGIQLTWDPNDEADLSGYRIYRGLNETFEPGPGNLLASVPDTATFDDGWTWDSGYFYKLAAVDIHGNESGYSLLAPSGVTGEEIPAASYLGQNYPNPFNPSTTIKFGLSHASHVSLKIYDTAGRLVRIVLDGDREAGVHDVHWDGLTAGGDRAASGVYFYRLTTAEFDRTRKMVLLR